MKVVVGRGDVVGRDGVLVWRGGVDDGCFRIRQAFLTKNSKTKSARLC